MVRVLSAATLVAAFFSFTNVIAHPTPGVPEHRAIARRASAAKTTVAKAATTSSKKTTTSSSKKTTTTSKKTTTTSKKTTTTSKKTTTTTTSSKKATTTSVNKAASTTASSKKTTTTTTSPKTTTTTTSSKTTTTTSSKTTTTTTKTSTSSASSSSQSGSGDTTQSIPTSAGVLSLLPVSGVLAGWTVAGTSPNVDSLVLSDSLFAMTHEMKALSHPVVAIDGKNAIHGHVQQGSVALSNSTTAGGFSFYTIGPKNTKVDLTKALEVSFAYSVKFSAGYGWNLGGKLPGLYGGVDANTAATCSGGNHNDGCFSCRFMWRDGGKGELYLYIPPDLNRANLCGSDGYGKCRSASDNGDTYGYSIGTGLWNFKDGDWVTIRQVVHLNTPGLQDGWVKVYVNGAANPTLYVQQLSFRNSAQSVFYGIQAQYFHGGHDSTWAAPQDQDAWFSDFSIAITQYSS